MKQPTDRYGVPLAVGDAIHSTAVNMQGQIAEIIPPGPALAISSDPQAAPQAQPGKIVLLFEVHVQYEDKVPAIQTLLRLAKEAPLDWVRVPVKSS